MKKNSPAKPPTETFVDDPESGFTLIELLIVVAIIAILAGLAFPAVQGAMGSAKKAQARNDVNQLAAAIKAFQLEYGRLPSTKAGSSDEKNAANKDVIKVLIGSNSTLNPKNIVFFEPKIPTAGKKGGLTNGSYQDPWGTDYIFALDTSYDNKIDIDVGDGSSKTYYTTAVVMSEGADKTAKTDNISNVK
jgi:prepilin-type N-terminal cleavage/methylation domain-containing protein